MMEGFSVSGLAAEWDGIASVRDRVRASGQFLFCGDPAADITNKTAVANQDFLVPLLLRLMASQLKLPEIENLRVAVKEL